MQWRSIVKAWFITGASRGFGLRIAQLALAQGDAVVATARNTAAVTERLGEHPNLLAVPLDVTDQAQARAAAAAAAAVERFGRIEAKHASDAAILADWRSVAASTDFVSSRSG
jgi:NAD(P)-dependent dehydrogenase (short-subunit alcohol dehydrogenase family)